MNKLKGMGGHMTAALLHEIDFNRRVFNRKIADAYEYGHIGQALKLEQDRDKVVRRIEARLDERGAFRQGIQPKPDRMPTFATVKAKVIAQHLLGRAA